MGTATLGSNIDTEDSYRDISKDAEKKFDTSRYSKNDNRPLPTGKNKKCYRHGEKRTNQKSHDRVWYIKGKDVSV